jgi:hypothetical protein
MKNLILLDNRIENIENIVLCLETNTDYIIFDYYEDTYTSILDKIDQIDYDCISIAQHNYNGHFFYFLHNEPHTESGHSAPILYSVITEDPLLTTWTDFIYFLEELKRRHGSQYIDFLACNLWSNENWVYVINRIRAKGIYIRASVDYTGSSGNFVLETDNVDTIGIYFTEEIKQYTFDLFITYPQPPIINTIIPQDKSLVVYLMELDDGGSPITKYMYSLNDSSYVDISGSIISPLTIDGLVNGVSYIVKFKAFNGIYESYDSEPWFPVIPYAEINEPIVLHITLTYPATLYIYGGNAGGVVSDVDEEAIIFPPSTPVINTVVAGNESAIVNFTQENNGGSSILYYKYSLNNEEYDIAQGNTSPIIINGLDNGVQYVLKLIANNGYVDSLPSLNSAPFTPYLSIDAPVVTSVTVGDQQITVYFTHNKNGFTVAYYRYTLDGGQTYITTNTTTSPLVITGLTNGQQYSFTMVGYTDTEIASLPSNTVVNIVPYKIPDQPIITQISSFDQSLHIYYDTSVNSNGRPVINYIYSLNGGTTYTSASQTSNPIIITGLVNGTLYNVSIKSQNIAGYSAPSNIVSARPANVPSVPAITDLTVTNLNATVSFTPSNANGNAITKYQYKLNNSANFVDIENLVNGSSFTLVNLSPSYYSIVVRAVNGIGPSSVSNSANFTTIVIVPPPAPIINKVIYVKNTKIATIKFTQPASAAPVYQYLVSTNGGPYKRAFYNGSFIHVPNLIFGNDYTFRIKAVNEFGTSPESNESEQISVIGVPSVPYIWKIDANYDNTLIYFTKVETNGSPLLHMYYKLNNGQWILYNGTVSPMVLPSLPNNSVNVISLKAVNLAGESGVSSSRTFRVLFDLPAIIKTPIFTVDISYITVTPRLPQLGNNVPILSINYLLYRNGVEDPSAISVMPTIPFIIPNTPSNVYYSLKISITTPVGTTVYSPITQEKIFIASYPFPPIIYTVRTFIDKAHIYILEQDYSNTIPNLSYLYSLNNSEYVDSFIDDANMPIIVDISTNVYYSLRVKAKNAAGISNPSKVSRFVSLFGVPKKPYLGKPVMTSTSYTSTMEINRNNGGLPVLGFKYSLDGVNYLPIYNSTTHLILRFLVPNTTYLVRLVAYNANGMSEPYIRVVKTLAA